MKGHNTDRYPGTHGTLLPENKRVKPPQGYAYTIESTGGSGPIPKDHAVPDNSTGYKRPMKPNKVRNS